MEKISDSIIDNTPARRCPVCGKRLKISSDWQVYLCFSCKKKFWNPAYILNTTINNDTPDKIGPLQIFAAITALFCAGYASMSIPNVISAIHFFQVHYERPFIHSLAQTTSAIAFLPLAAVMFAVSRRWNSNKARSYTLSTCISGIMAFSGCLLLLYVEFTQGYNYDISNMLWMFVAATGIGVVSLFGLLSIFCSAKRDELLGYK